MSQDDLELRRCLEPHWFRVEARHWSVSDEWGDHSYTQSEVVILRVPVRKHTPKGAWIGRRLVLREYQHRGRAYAAPTIDQAKEDFRKRKAFQIRRLQSQLARAEGEIHLLDQGPIRHI